MKITKNSNAKSVKKAVNTGMLFKQYRHEATNYEHAYRTATRNHGHDSEAYREAVKEFASQVRAELATLKGRNAEAWKQAVDEWEATHTD
jgi:hypothetical protein